MGWKCSSVGTVSACEAPSSVPQVLYGATGLFPSPQRSGRSEVQDHTLLHGNFKASPTYEVHLPPKEERDTAISLSPPHTHTHRSGMVSVFLLTAPCTTTDPWCRLQKQVAFATADLTPQRVLGKSLRCTEIRHLSLLSSSRSQIKGWGRVSSVSLKDQAH